MKIVDSLLLSRFFLSRRGAENPLSFSGHSSSGRSSASGSGIDSQVHRAQLGAVVPPMGGEFAQHIMIERDRRDVGWATPPQ